jgi:hypothetical protein
MNHAARDDAVIPIGMPHTTQHKLTLTMSLRMEVVAMILCCVGLGMPRSTVRKIHMASSMSCDPSTYALSVMLATVTNTSLPNRAWVMPRTAKPESKLCLQADTSTGPQTRFARHARVASPVRPGPHAREAIERHGVAVQSSPDTSPPAHAHAAVKHSWTHRSFKKL